MPKVQGIDLGAERIMSSDDIRPPIDLKFRTGGHGHYSAHLCARCHLKTSCATMRWRGGLNKLCAPCRDVVRAARN
ncbi:MAG TPA: hypothetical protein VLD59_08225 [Steroidobacteraceae bacterium]|nr:hypothetical protein [Steroidobacteraceae bacterium]